MAPIVEKQCEVPRSHFVLLLSLIVDINKQLSRHVAQRATVARAKRSSFWQVINGKDCNYRWQKVAHLPQNYWLVRIALGYLIAPIILLRHVIELITDEREDIDDHRYENYNFALTSPHISRKNSSFLCPI